MFGNKDILKLISLGEGQYTEFKTSFQKEVIESIVAFSNAKGGNIFVGVSDDRSIIGLSLTEESIQNYIIKWGNRATN